MWKSLGASTQQQDEERKVKKCVCREKLKADAMCQWSDITSQVHLAAFVGDNWNNNVLLQGAPTPAEPASADSSSELSTQQMPKNWILAQFAIMKFRVFERFQPVVQWSPQRHPVVGGATSSDWYWNSGSSIETQRIFGPTPRKIKTSKQFPTRWRWMSARQQTNQSTTARPDGLHRPITCQVYLWTLPLLQTALTGFK